MSSAIRDAFPKDRCAFIPYLTAGFPGGWEPRGTERLATTRCNAVPPSSLLMKKQDHTSTEVIP
ncbi:MAG: hypothetical protein AB1646_24385 [Thermodesulfobacteriota bacterium]